MSMKKIAVTISLAAISMCAYAGSISEGLVTWPLVNSTGYFMFSAGTMNGRPPCATSTMGNYAVNTNEAGGRAIQAMVLTAYANGKTLHVEGKGVCDVWIDRESVLYLYIVN